MKTTAAKLTKPQQEVLDKMAAGWNLLRAGREGLGGWLGKFVKGYAGRKGKPISVANMNALYGTYIHWNSDYDKWELTAEGKAAAKPKP